MGCMKSKEKEEELRYAYFQRKPFLARRRKQLNLKKEKKFLDIEKKFKRDTDIYARSSTVRQSTELETEIAEIYNSSGVGFDENSFFFNTTRELRTYSRTYSGPLIPSPDFDGLGSVELAESDYFSPVAIALEEENHQSRSQQPKIYDDNTSLQNDYMAVDEVSSGARLSDASDERNVLDDAGYTGIDEEWSNSKEVKESEEFYVIKDTDFLPRYTYHRSLLDWCTEALPMDPIFQECHFDECTIITGGCINNEIISNIFGETAMHGKVAAGNLHRGAGDTMNAGGLILYFFRNNIAKAQQNIVKLKHQLPFENGLILFVMTTESIDDERLKSRIIEIFSQLQISQVEFVLENRSEIIKKLTYTLEQRIFLYLEQTKIKLREYSLSHNVGSSLMEVNATLRRLKQAACYPKPFRETEEEENEYTVVDELLERLDDKILFSEYDGERLYVITADQRVKELLEVWFHNSRFKSINLVITVEDTLQICELGETGVPLHGAKFVFVDEEAEAFHANESFATSGSLMEANNDTSKFTVAVTCQHAVEKSETLYTLIDESVVKLGQVLPQPNNKMTRLHDDIAAVLIDDDTGAILNNKCEKLLIDDSEFPSPARISLRDLKKGDIVHKRGAKTGLTTGTVKDIKFEPIGQFPLPSRVIFISGRESKQFADKGDSGSLVFQHSLSAEENVLDVFAMVQGKLRSPNPNAVIICFPFKDGCENLTKNIPDLQELRFFEV